MKSPGNVWAGGPSASAVAWRLGCRPSARRLPPSGSTAGCALVLPTPPQGGSDEHLLGARASRPHPVLASASSPPVPPVKPAEVAVPDSLPQNAPSRPPSRVFLPRGSPRGSVRGCSWRGSREAVRSGRGALIRRARSCGSTGFTRPRAHIAQRDAFHDEVLHSDRLGEPTQIPGFKPNQLGFLKPNRIDRRTVGRWIEIEFPSSDPQRR